MNAEETKQAAAVMIAWAEGKKIQARGKRATSQLWRAFTEHDEPPMWQWDDNEYRIAPEPMEVEVWAHEDGSIRQKSWYEHSEPSKGWTLRRATIHPETK